MKLLAPVFLLGLLAPAITFAQDCKGTFVDGECVEGYVYVPDFMSPQDLKKDIDQHTKDIVIVDTAAPPIWEEEHIPGAFQSAVLQEHFRARGTVSRKNARRLLRVQR